MDSHMTPESHPTPPTHTSIIEFAFPETVLGPTGEEALSSQVKNLQKANSHDFERGTKTHSETRVTVTRSNKYDDKDSSRK